MESSGAIFDEMIEIEITFIQMSKDDEILICFLLNFVTTHLDISFSKKNRKEEASRYLWRKWSIFFLTYLYAL